MDTLVCYHCKVTKPTSEFHRSTSSPRGYQSLCKQCKADYQAKHKDAHLASSRKSYAKNIEKERARSAAKHRKDPSKALARSRKHRRLRREHVRAKARTLYWNNHERYLLYAKRDRIHHAARRRTYSKRYALANRGKIYAWNNARQLFIRYATKGEPVNLDILYLRDRGICQICHTRCARKDASRDHVIPLSLGGEHSYRNCALAHLRCNSAKGNRTVPQQQRLF